MLTDTRTDANTTIETDQNTQMTGSTVQSPEERGIMLAEQQYNEIVEQREKAALLEQSFLSGLMDDTENSTISPESRTQTTADPSSMTAQERLALLGETILDKGGMPSQEQLSAMGIDEPTARGIQSLVWLSKENSPTARRAVEAMVDLTAPQMENSVYEQLPGTVSGAGETYSPINPGPLEEDVANSFNGATYTMRELSEDTVMYRVSGGVAEIVGSYMTETRQMGGLQSQLDLALLPKWGNTAENVRRVIVPKGTIIYEGTVAPQNICDSHGNVIGTLPGGGNQVYIPHLDERWFQ